jgi:uncharacterized RDD family membrane protein YckC
METPVTTAAMSPRPAFHYAGFWKRFLAYILDQIIMSVFAFFIIVPFLAMVGISLWSSDFEPTGDFIFTLISAYLMMIVLLLAGEWLYFALMESMKGATLGKMALGITVTDLYGNRISFGRASGRYFGKILSSLTIGIGYIMAGITAQKQALHDMIASCLVINK